MSTLDRFLGWLRYHAGDRWPVIVKTVDGMVTTFLLVLLARLTAAGLFDGNLGTGESWRAAGLAALVAALNVAKSALMILLTGQPALGGLVSSQLRAQRELRTVRHKVALREPVGRRAHRRAHVGEPRQGRGRR